jgi:hypothetical protein
MDHLPSSSHFDPVDDKNVIKAIRLVAAACANLEAFRVYDAIYRACQEAAAARACQEAAAAQARHEAAAACNPPGCASQDNDDEYNGDEDEYDDDEYDKIDDDDDE